MAEEKVECGKCESEIKESEIDNCDGCKTEMCVECVDEYYQVCQDCAEICGRIECRNLIKLYGKDTPMMV